MKIEDASTDTLLETCSIIKELEMLSATQRRSFYHSAPCYQRGKKNDKVIIMMRGLKLITDNIVKEKPKEDKNPKITWKNICSLFFLVNAVIYISAYYIGQDKGDIAFPLTGIVFFCVFMGMRSPDTAMIIMNRAAKIFVFILGNVTFWGGLYVAFNGSPVFGIFIILFGGGAAAALYEAAESFSCSREEYNKTNNYVKNGNFYADNSSLGKNRNWNAEIDDIEEDEALENRLHSLQEQILYARKGFNFWKGVALFSLGSILGIAIVFALLLNSF